MIFIRYVAVDNGLNITENYNLFFLNTSWRAWRCRWKKKILKINRLFLAYNTPGHLQVPTKKIQPIRSSRLAGYKQHIYIYECLVLLYRLYWICTNCMYNLKVKSLDLVQYTCRVALYQYYPVKKILYSYSGAPRSI